MSYSDSYPSVRPLWQLDASNGGRIPPNATFTRSDTPPTYAAPSAVHYWSNEKHLSSDNLFLQSSTFDNAAWSNNGITETAGQTDPSGGSSAYKLLENTSSSYHNVYQTVSGNESWSLTVYAKQNTGTRYLGLRIYGAAINNYETAVFDLAGSAPSVASGSSSGYSNVTATQTASGNGFYKCTLKATGSIAEAAIHISQNSTATGLDQYGVAGYTGDGTSSIDLAFASLSSVSSTEYVPTTTQIHRQYAPTLKSVSYAGQPRFEYSPTDGESMGVLIESASTNLVTRSSELDDAGWTKGALNIDANASISVDGTLTADLLRPTTASGAHYAVTGASTTASSTYTASAYVKAAGYSKVRLFFYQSSPPNTHEADATFTLSGSGSAITSVGSSTITAVGGGYYRISVTGVVGSSYSNLQIRPVNNAGTDNFTGDGYSGILCTGVQFELGNHASSLISTSGSQVSRASDSLSVVDSNLFDNGGGSIVMELENTGRSIYGAILEDDSTGNYQDYIALTVRADDKARQTVNAPGSSTQSDLFSAASTVDGSYFKIASRFAPNDFGVCIDGGTVATDTTGAVPSNVDKLFIGYYDDGGRANAHIKRVAVYSEPLSDTNLQALTK